VTTALLCSGYGRWLTNKKVRLCKAYLDDGINGLRVAREAVAAVQPVAPGVQEEHPFSATRTPPSSHSAQQRCRHTSLPSLLLPPGQPGRLSSGTCLNPFLNKKGATYAEPCHHL